MIELVGTIGTWLGLLFLVFITLLSFGANFAPEWAKSSRFLAVAGALVILGSNGFQ